MADHNFTSADMAVVGDVFIAAFDRAFGRYGTNRDVIQTYVVTVCNSVQPRGMMTPEGIKNITQMTFDQRAPDIADFIDSLTFQFFGRWGDSSTKFEGLVATLAKAMSADNIAAGMNIIPKEILQRTSDEEGTKACLSANKWLITIALMCIFVGLDAGGAGNATSRKPHSDQSKS